MDKTAQDNIEISSVKIILNSSNKNEIPHAQNVSLQQNEEKISLFNYQTMGKKIDSEKIIVSTIDNIYFSIQDLPVYFRRLKIILFLIAVFNLAFLWMFFTMLSPIKNKNYCYDHFSKEFKVCDQNEICEETSKGVNFIIFTDEFKNGSNNNTDNTILNELFSVNKLYLKYFLKDEAIFSLLNTKTDKFNEIDVYYTIIFAITKNEKWNFFVAFNQYCNRNNVMIQLMIICFLSIVLGNIIFGYGADIFGRKVVLIILSIIQFLGCIAIYFMSTEILNVCCEDSSQLPTLNCAQSYNNSIQNYLNINEDMEAFDNQNINSKYKEQFCIINELKIKSKTVRENFKAYKIVIYIGFSMVFLGISASTNISLAYLLENSINDSYIYSDYIFYHYSIPVSYLLQFVLMTQTNSFHIPYLFIGGCSFFMSIILLLVGYESPRHNYEFYEYDQITTFFKSIKKDLNIKLFRNSNAPELQKELQKQSHKTNFGFIICNKILFLGFRKNVKKYRESILFNNFKEVKRQELISNPYLLYLLLFNNKYIKENILITTSLTAIVSNIFFLTTIKFNLSLVVSRDRILDNNIFNTYIFYQTITMCISLIIFKFILKILGFNIVLSICFFFILIFSVIFEILSFYDGKNEDMNSFNYNSMDILYSKKSSELNGLLFVINFFSTGLYTSMFFYFSKLSKTLYRCTFFGLFHIILDFGSFLSLILSEHFDKNFFYVAVLSGIGFINAYFIKEDFDFTIIGDFRKIELDND